jgi:hypothetical protein
MLGAAALPIFSVNRPSLDVKLYAVGPDGYADALAAAAEASKSFMGKPCETSRRADCRESREGEKCDRRCEIYAPLLCGIMTIR